MGVGGWQAGLLVLQLERLGEEATMTVAIAKIRELAQSPSFRDRQMYVLPLSHTRRGPGLGFSSIDSHFLVTETAVG